MQKLPKGILVLQKEIHRDSFSLNWFKPSGLGIPCKANSELIFEKCIHLAWQDQHMLIWKRARNHWGEPHRKSSLARFMDEIETFPPWKVCSWTGRWQGYCLALSHLLFSYIKAANEIISGLPAEKTFSAWIMVEWDWKPDKKQNQVYFQEPGCNSSFLLQAARWRRIFMVKIWH